jgi:hypothetical protein
LSFIKFSLGKRAPKNEYSIPEIDEISKIAGE